MKPSFPAFIWPMSPEEFIYEHRGKSPVYFPGTPDKYASLVDTHNLSQVLSRIVASQGLVRIRRPEGAVPSEEFLTPVVPIVGSHRQVIKGEALEQELASGGTLSVEQCESHFENVHAMCSMLAEVFVARAYAFLFLVYKPERPCGVHWDSYDMFICQVAGYKNWPVYKPAYENPALFDPNRSAFRPRASEMVQEFKLGPGDGLYIPRGWAHDPVAVDGPSMHVAFAIATPTGIDLLDWIRAELNRTSAYARADLPLPLSPSAKRAYSARFREVLMEHVSDGAIESYFERHRVSVCPRPVDLPEVPAHCVAHAFSPG
jgi:hypothetical protein